MGSEKQKKLIRMAVWLLREKLGKCATAEAIKDDMTNCPNPIFQQLADLMYRAEAAVDSGWSKKIIGEVGVLELWIMYKDTAYKPVVLWMLRELKHKIEDDPVFAQQIEDEASEPEDWYVNTWIRSMKKTKQLRKQGKIPEYAESHEESIFIPSKQKKRLKRL